MNTMRIIEENYGFPQVIGAIDGTHIKIAAPKLNTQSYINRKGFHSMQLQVNFKISSFFLYVKLEYDIICIYSFNRR